MKIQTDAARSASRSSRVLPGLAAILLAAGCGARTGLLPDDEGPADADEPVVDADEPVVDADEPVVDADEPVVDADATPPGDTWIKTLTASGGVRAVAAAPGGGASLLGWAPDGVSLFLATVSPGGEVLDHRLFQGVNIYELDAAAHPEGGFVVASDIAQGGASGYDVWVARLDGDGQFLWQEALSLTVDQRFADVHVTSSGLAIVTASMMAPGGYLDDLWVVAIEPDGAIAWQKQLDDGGRTSDGGFAAEDAEGVVIENSVYDGVERSWLVAMTLEGEVRWQRMIEPERDESYAVTGLHADDLGLVLVGQVADYTPQDYCEPWVARMSPSGDLEWQWMYPDGDCGWFDWIVPDGDELIVLGDLNLAPPGSPDWVFSQWLMRLDPDGLPIRQVRYAFSGSSYTSGVVESGDDLIFAGDAYFGSFSAFAARVTRNGDLEGRCDSISETGVVPVETTAVVSPYEGRLIDTVAVVIETDLVLTPSRAQAETICPQ